MVWDKSKKILDCPKNQRGGKHAFIKFAANILILWDRNQIMNLILKITFRDGYIENHKY